MNEEPKYLFGDMVVVDNDQIGLIVKVWKSSKAGEVTIKYEVYVRNYYGIKEYPETEVERYKVRHKELSEEELEWQNNYF